MDKKEPLIVHIKPEGGIGGIPNEGFNWKLRAAELEVQLATENGWNKWMTRIALGVAIGCIGFAVLGAHFFDTARQDRLWLTSSSQDGEEWRVAVPPIERDFLNWRPLSPVVVVRGATEAIRAEWEAELRRDVKDALQAGGTYDGGGFGSTLLVEMFLEGSIYDQRRIRFTATNWTNTGVIWQEEMEVEDSPTDWQNKLIQVVRLGVGGGMPDGTWGLRVESENLAERKKRARDDEGYWKAAEMAGSRERS